MSNEIVFDTWEIFKSKDGKTLTVRFTMEEPWVTVNRIDSYTYEAIYEEVKNTFTFKENEKKIILDFLLDKEVYVFKNETKYTISFIYIEKEFLLEQETLKQNKEENENN